jgi:hypothetical protein
MEPVGLAVDWVFGHLYWTDTVYRAVMMSNLDGTGRIIVATKNLIIPRGIAVDPKRRSGCLILHKKEDLFTVVYRF